MESKHLNRDLVVKKLPLHCEVNYYKNFLDRQEAEALYLELSQLLLQIDYAPQTVDGVKFDVNFGKIMFMSQSFLDQNKFPEQLWGPTRVWTPKLEILKEKIEDVTAHKFEICVLIHYPDGQSGVDFHSDYVAFGDTTLIPSVSLGEERIFKFREKASGDEFAMILEHGSLILMGKDCQDRYEHALPIDPKYLKPRINLTFRKYGFAD